MRSTRTAFLGVIAALMIGSLPAAAPAQAQASAAILDLMNTVRAKYHAPPLEWNNDLARAATAYTKACKNKPSNADGRYGESRWHSTNNNAGIRDAVNAWAGQASKYRFDNRYSSETGDFTQLVWKDSSRVGAGIAKCSTGTFVVARYTPPGNIPHRFAQNVLRP
ncbi:CAP family protein [Nocardia fusca]|uniref:CAP family protein n=1 Tax=Nocardia fusca TaxID=941183 RepID=UPI00379A0FEF